MELKDLVDDVLRKIGRNMMLFQHLEYLLKYVVANGNWSGLASELENNKAKKEKAIKNQTMGQLVGQFLESSNPDHEADSNEPEELKEAYISFSFSIETDSKSYASQEVAWKKFVSERNELIHHLLPKFDTKSKSSCDELSIKLDTQSEVIRRKIKEIQSLVEALDKGRKELASYFASDEVRREVDLNFLTQSRLAMALVDIANQLGNEDGWVLLSSAGQIIKQNIPDELALLNANYGFEKLKDFMLATELFEFNEEQTSRGGVRIFYKLR
ncbi:OST-HTH/LOTUS domain-containing protein [Aliiglaciecola litoralis]|uniref:OST-HTH/LOTUS domain-containing protein n=1 Tax=Aliiglaciecola litoralis TaxID=582857 RepID=A0ABP3WWT3_9ALTE